MAPETPPEAWARCRPWIEQALEHTRGAYLIEDVEAQIERGEAWFWPGARSALVTEIAVYPRKRFAVYWLAGGDMDELLDMEPSVVAWAQRMGCDGIIEMGRPGWVKKLKSYGYSPLYAAVWKELK